MNILRPGDDDLVTVDYSDLLEKIVEVLKNQQTKNPFSIKGDCKRLLIDIDLIATKVASLQVENPLGASANSVRTATVNFSPGFKERFPDKVRQIKNLLKQLLESVFSQQKSISSPEHFIADLATSLESFKGNTPKLDLSYTFDSYPNLQKQRLSFQPNSSGSRELLKLHKLTITVQNTYDFNIQLKDGLANYINTNFASASENDREDLEYILEDLQEENIQSDFYKLKQIVDSETLGRLKRQAQVNYLEFLLDNLNINSSPANAEAAIYLQDLIRRLKLIDEYIGDIEKGDGHYQVNYAGASVNYRDFLSSGEAFDMLPIIPKIEGYLGETTNENRGELQFIFGLKLKFNNPVQAHGGRTVFDYHLNFIDPNSEKHKTGLEDNFKREYFAQKVLKILFIYSFIFASKDPSEETYQPSLDLEYDPISFFETKVLPILKGSDDESKKKLFHGVQKGLKKYKIESKINLLRQRLINLLNHKKKFPTREYPLHISVKRSILEQDIVTVLNNNTLFKTVLRGNPKEVLKYISITGARAEANSLCTLPAKITISDIPYFSTEERQHFNMEYDITGIKALPILLVPKEKQCRKVYEDYFTQRQLIVFPYALESNNLDHNKLFVYQFTFSLLLYIVVKVLLEKQSRLFIPIVRLHLSNKQDEKPIESFMVSLSKTLSHLLNEEHRSNAQGIDIRDLQSKGKYKVPNVLSSLYSVLPKKFQLIGSSPAPQLDKLAIIVVSSRESDARFSSSQKISSLTGEVIGISLKEDTIRLQLLKTFSDNYDHSRIFKDPTVIIDEVNKIYKLGYKHFLYIAKAPYSSTLHLTQKEDENELFFMSKDIISALKSKYNDIKLYPMFFDKYYVVRLAQLGVNSLYIQDTTELTNLVEDPSKQSVVFFNLFNGITVGKKEERNYNGVMSYATLLNIYKGILDDENIRTGLIYQSSLKNDILNYLTLFHFSRYEKAKQISFKLDPYENLIGEESVGKLSLFTHMKGKGNFNCLAFLTEVKKILNTPGGNE